MSRESGSKDENAAKAAKRGHPARPKAQMSRESGDSYYNEEGVLLKPGAAGHVAGAGFRSKGDSYHNEEGVLLKPGAAGHEAGAGFRYKGKQGGKRSMDKEGGVQPGDSPAEVKRKRSEVARKRGRQGPKARLAKEPKDAKAAKNREHNSRQEARRKQMKSVDMDKGRLAEDEAALEAQRLGVMNDVKLWRPSDGTAIKGKLQYTREELRNALKAKDKADYARPLPQLVLAVKDAYGWAS